MTNRERRAEHCRQINAFYLRKEAELRLRLDTLLSKRKAAAQRLSLSLDEVNPEADHVEWRAIDEGFALLEQDLAKLQVCGSLVKEMRLTFSSAIY